LSEQKEKVIAELRRACTILENVSRELSKAHDYEYGA
jgi:hypothetical protein